MSLDREFGKHVEGKTEANAAAENIRTAIRNSAFVPATERKRQQATAPPVVADAVTLNAFASTFFERSKKDTTNNRACFSRLSAFVLPGATGGCTLGEKPLKAITEDDVELFFSQLRSEGRAASTQNKYVQLARAMFRWAVKKGYLARNPILDSDVIKRQKIAQRSRRLVPDVLDPKSGKVLQAGEETALLAVAGSHLQRLIIAALETGIRLCELLRLQWRNVDMAGHQITIRADIAKTSTERTVPMSTRLHSVLEMAQTALDGGLPKIDNERERANHVAKCFVFGDSVGRRVAVIRKAWDTAVLKAHGHQPVWCASNTLAPASRAALREIDLHFHDLRHEAGSRFIERGWPVHHVKEMLGHKDLSQTSTYLNATVIGLHESMRKFDEPAKVCKAVANGDSIEPAPPCKPEAATETQVLVN